MIIKNPGDVLHISSQSFHSSSFILVYILSLYIWNMPHVTVEFIQRSAVLHSRNATY
jgi:hypothetical protein